MPQNVAGVGDGDSLQDWFKTLPIVTKTFLVSTLLGGAMVTFGMVSPYDMVLDWYSIKNKFHFWRLFTAFVFAGKFSFNFAMHTYVLYENCKRYEANPFNTGGGGTSSDFVWMILVSMAVLLLISYYFDMLILSEPILYVIMYNWSRREADRPVGIFGFKFKAIYLPWVYVGIRLIMGGSITEPLVGIAVGHLYYFLIEVLPLTHGYNVIRTPKFCMDLVSYVEGRTPPAAQQPAAYTGIGRTLGGAAGGTAAAGAAPGVRRGLATLFTEPTAAPATANNPADQTGHAPGLRQRGTNPPPSGHNWGTGRTLGTN
mmetsp:Transcript_28318/g.56606  ORF Transcript_28318/g.56606 Transcript_28318/m.56606 type:complete len:314 (+) Transcript_28318:53-994(+)